MESSTKGKDVKNGRKLEINVERPVHEEKNEDEKKKKEKLKNKTRSKENAASQNY